MNVKPIRIFPALLVILIALIGFASGAPARARAEPARGGLEIASASHNFGITPVGQLSLVQSFTVWNRTGADLEVYASGIFTNIPDGFPDFNFTITADTCIGQELFDDRYCHVDVVFSPLSNSSHTAYLAVFAAYVNPPPIDPEIGTAKLTGNNYPTTEVSNFGGKNAGKIGDPITTSVGEYHFDKPLLNLGGPLPLEFTLYYGSMMRTGKIGGDNDTLGGDWAHNYHLSLLEWAPDTVLIQYGPGDLIKFQKSGNEWQVVNEETIYQLREDPGHYYLLDPVLERISTFEKDIAREIAYLTRIEDRNGNALTFTNDGKGRVLRIEDGLGRSLTFSYSTPPKPWDNPQLTQVTDQTGRSIRFGYPNPWGGNLATVTDPMGLVTTFSYNGSDADSALIAQTLPRRNIPYQHTYQRVPSESGWRVVTQTDAYNNTTRLDFDDYNGETTITDPLGNTRQHTHQDKRLLTVIRDETGLAMSFAYDAQGRRTAVTDRLGDTTQIIYHPETGNLATYTDAEGNTTTYTYTAQNQTLNHAGTNVTFTFYNLTRTTYADGTHEDFLYDGKGNVTGYTDRAAQVLGYQYDARGQLTRLTNPTGGVVQFTYNSDGTLASSRDLEVGTTVYGYDGYKRLATITRPGGGAITMTYDLDDRPLTITDELGRTTTYGYDANDNLVRETNPLNQVISYGYDLMDRLVTRTDPLGRASTYTYDALSRLDSFTNRSGNTTTYTYDSRGWQTGITNPAGQTWDTGYDDEGVLASETTPLGFTTGLQTNKLGRVTAITDPLGAVARYTYDAMGRRISTADRMSRVTTYGYDGEGRLVGVTPPLIGVATYTRNGLGKLTRITDPRGKHWNFGYSTMGRRTSHTDPLGNQWTYAYDNRGRLSQITYPDGGAAVYTYDAASQLTQIAYSGGPTLNFTYDAAGRLLTADHLALTYDARGDITNSQDGAASFGATYDNERRIKTVTYDNQATVTYTYNSRDLLIRVEDNRAGAWMTFSYDNDDRLTGITRSNGVSTSYTYDNVGRVTRIQDGALADQQYTLNAEGEPTQAIRTLPLDPNPQSQISNLSYDDASQIASAGYTYDSRGRLIQSPSHQFTYDGADRLTSVTSGAETADFSYNGFGKLRTRTAGDVTTTYYHNYALELDPIVAEKQGTSYKRFYVYTPSGALLYSIDAGNGAVHFYHFDRLGSTLFLTDGAGAVSDAYAYDPYGNLVAHTGNRNQPFTYVGQFGVRWEPVGGLYDMRARAYDPATARFLTRDPVWPVLSDHAGLNPYQYGYQNPLAYVDPEGTSVLSKLWQKIKAWIWGEAVEEAAEQTVETIVSQPIPLTPTAAFMVGITGDLGFGMEMRPGERPVSDKEKEEIRRQARQKDRLLSKERELEADERRRIAMGKTPEEWARMKQIYWEQTSAVREWQREEQKKRWEPLGLREASGKLQQDENPMDIR
ncbi:MAG: hypothetical protein HY741_12960 [Chloroflexi bacterium]|nr:hypothetical protein [Chloroflexota bacterium]